MSPAQGSYPATIVFSTAVPLVAVSMALRRPSRPRVGILYFSREAPSAGARGHRVSGQGRKAGRQWQLSKSQMHQRCALISDPVPPLPFNPRTPP